MTATLTLCGRFGIYGDIDLNFVWQAMAFGEIDTHFVWHAWHVWLNPTPSPTPPKDLKAERLANVRPSYCNIIVLWIVLHVIRGNSIVF